MNRFPEIWIVDFEFQVPPGCKPIPLCVAAFELHSNQTIQYWIDQDSETRFDFPSGPDSLYVSFFASAEVGCHLVLDWPIPNQLIDLYVEFRNLTNGRTLPCGNGLLGAMAYFGLSVMDSSEKSEFRDLAIRGGPYSPSEKQVLLDYCLADVKATTKLFLAMREQIDYEHALFRGRYMVAVAKIELRGIPVDETILNKLQSSWPQLRSRLIEAVDKEFQVYEGDRFKAKQFSQWLRRQDFTWPCLPSGQLDLKDSTFKEMSLKYPILQPLRELRASLSQIRLTELPVGSDGRNRCLLSPFRSRTGRNQPSNTRFLFGPAVWVRFLMKPKSGWGLAYIDWSQQEFGIAAALSKDVLMMDAYTSGDPYLAFAKQAGAVPEDATKQSHKIEREQFKACVLAVQYGMGAESLAQKINQPVIQAKRLLQLHKATYRTFWEWSDAVVDHAMLHGSLQTVFGWQIHIGPDVNPRFLRNFPMQANGAEMLRLAAVFLMDAGIRTCAPIHDALLIEAPLDELERDISRTQELMADASAIVLDGFRLRSDAEVVVYPDRYRDPRGEGMWQTISHLMEETSHA